MIQSYGLHWRLDKVYWGKQKVSGTLLGAASRAKTARPIDFREQRGVYALFADYDLVYIGQTGGGADRLFKRLRTHRSDHLADRWNQFSWFGTQGVTTQSALSKDTAAIKETVQSVLNVLEAISIAISEPRLNLQRGRWGDAKQYFQYVAGLELEDD